MRHEEPKPIKRIAIKPGLRRLITERDESTCQYCGKIDSRFIIEHIIPVAHYGVTEPYNLVVACRSCNARKSQSVWIPYNLDLITAGYPSWRHKIIEQAVLYPNQIPRKIFDKIPYRGGWKVFGTEWQDHTYSSLCATAMLANRDVRDMLDEAVLLYVNSHPVNRPPAALRAALTEE